MTRYIYIYINGSEREHLLVMSLNATNGACKKHVFDIYAKAFVNRKEHQPYSHSIILHHITLYIYVGNTKHLLHYSVHKYAPCCILLNPHMYIYILPTTFEWCHINRAASVQLNLNIHIPITTNIMYEQRATD